MLFPSLKHTVPSLPSLAALCALPGLLVVIALSLGPTPASAQFSNKVGNVAGAVGGACDSTTVDYAWPNTNGYILKCVANVWTIVNQPATVSASGSTGYVQFNNAGALGSDSNFFWDQTNHRLGIGTTVPGSLLNISGTDASIFNVSSSSTNHPWGSSSVALTLQNQSNTTYSASILGFLSNNTSGAQGVSYIRSETRSNGLPDLELGVSTGTNSYNEIARIYNTGLGLNMSGGLPANMLDVGGAAVIGTSYAGATTAPGNGLLVQGNVGIGTATVTNKLDVNGAASIGYVNTAAPSNGLLVSGQVGIGTTTSLAAEPALIISKHIPSYGQIYLDNPGPSYFRTGVLFTHAGAGSYYISNDYANNGSNDIFFARYGSAPALIVSAIDYVGIGTTSPTSILSLGGNTARTFGMERDTAASTAGQNLTVRAGGANATGTDLAGGNLILSSGITTGTGTSNIQLQTYPATTTGTADNTATTALTVSQTGTGGTNAVTSLQANVASGTDKNGGNLVLASGTSTGTGSSQIQLNVYGAGSTGSAANSPTTAVTVASSGNVGIGTTAPTSTLQVQGSLAVQPDPTSQLSYAYNSTGSISSLQIATPITNANSNTILSAYRGDVTRSHLVLGVNTAVGGSGNDPTLTSYGGNFSTGLYLHMASNRTYPNSDFYNYVSIGTTSNASSSDLFTIRQSGNVGIGTTSPGDKLAVNGGVVVGTSTSYAGGTNAAPASGMIVQGNVGIGTTLPIAMLHVGSASAVGVIADLQNTAGYCTLNPSSNALISTCSSDIRLKTHIRDAGDVLGWIGGLRLREFDLKVTGEHRMGVIAQEVQETHPEMVSMGSNGFYQVEIPDAWKLVKAIQELKAQNDNQAHEIADLKDEVRALRSEIRTRYR